MTEEFYQFRAAEGDDPDSAELLLFGPIGDWEDMGEVSAKQFAKDLAKLPASVKRLDLHINSPGGSLFEANAIYSRLADHRSTKNVFIDGIAASAATIIAMVGHKIYVRSNATMMVHMPSGIVMGNAEDMRQTAMALDTVTESMINVYEKRTGMDRDAIRALLTAETWMTPAQAVENGFADEVRGVVKAAAKLGDNIYDFNGREFDLSRFNNVPAFSAKQPTKPRRNMNINDTDADAKAKADADAKIKADADAKAQADAKIKADADADAKAKADAAAKATDFEKGGTAERERVAALMKLDRPETHKIVTDAIKDGKTAQDIFDAVLDAIDKAKGNADRHTDAGQLNRIPPADGTGEDNNEFGALIAKKVQDRLKQRHVTSAQHGRN